MRTAVLMLLLAGLIGGLVPAVGFAADTSLLQGRTYPPPDCRSPLRPLPEDGPRDWRRYRADMEDYRHCVAIYLDTAKQDIERIRKQMDKAVRTYNQESGNGM
ncbi:MAG: UBX domain-containing protein 8 [Bilophila sp.]